MSFLGVHCGKLREVDIEWEIVPFRAHLSLAYRLGTEADRI